MKRESKRWWVQWGRNVWAVKLYLFGVPTGVVSFFVLLFLKERYAHALYAWMFHFFGIFSTRSLVGFLVLLMGVAASLFKQKNQMWYGLIEFIFGVGSGFAIASGLSPERPFSPQWVTLVGCAYVIARGLNNIVDGGKAREALQKARPL